MVCAAAASGDRSGVEGDEVGVRAGACEVAWAVPGAIREMVAFGGVDKMTVGAVTGCDAPETAAPWASGTLKDLPAPFTWTAASSRVQSRATGGLSGGTWQLLGKLDDVATLEVIGPLAVSAVCSSVGLNIA